MSSGPDNARRPSANPVGRRSPAGPSRPDSAQPTPGPQDPHSGFAGEAATPDSNAEFQLADSREENAGDLNYTEDASQVGEQLLEQNREPNCGPIDLSGAHVTGDVDRHRLAEGLFVKPTPSSEDRPPRTRPAHLHEPGFEGP